MEFLVGLLSGVGLVKPKDGSSAGLLVDLLSVLVGLEVISVGSGSSRGLAFD